jgi:hypothetical protein
MLAPPTAAQNYPAKPVRILAGAAPGGLIDLFPVAYRIVLHQCGLICPCLQILGKCARESR